MAKGKIGIIGSGVVARTLGAGFLKHGYEVMLGTREPGKLKDWSAKEGSGARVGAVEDAARFGEVVVLAVKGTGAEAALGSAAKADLAGKTVIDATNPIADEPPVDGVLRYFTGPNESLMERLQRLTPQAHLVKAFNSIGNPFMVDPNFPGGKPTMFICGDSADAKRKASGILEEFGFEVADMGPVQAARAIEPLAMLWCIPGLRSNSWSHAFKLLQQ